MVVNVQRHGDVAVISMDNPPVNALGVKLRAGLMEALDGLRNQSDLAAIVLAGTARAFSGGADITEFGKPPAEPNLRVVIAAVEDMPIPVVAAIQGVALGGGLELALGCHARVVWASAKLGLPEVKLGILPGAGGTQRLPRVVGVEKALGMIVTGNPIGGSEAASIGLADALLEGPYPQAAVEWARKGVEKRKVRDRDEKLQPAKDDAGLIDRVAAPSLKASGAQSPRACVESVRNAVTMPFDDGLAAERKLFETLVTGDESRAQRHAFFAEREAQKVRLPEGTSARPIRRAAVIGAGTMGGGIAMCFANAGIPVTVIETEQAALDRGLGRIGELYQGSAKRGSITAEQAETRRGLIGGALDIEGVREADVIVEAVFEEMSVKKEVFGKLDRLAKPGAVLATNTSYLDIDEIAASTSRPGDVIGMHFFSPANVMRLLEIVRGKATSPETIATASELGKRLGKVSIVVGNCFGFVGNRMLSKRTEAAERLLLDGASPQEVDRALTDFGFRMGPFAMADLAGLDIGMRIRKAFGKVAPVADAITAAGRYGQKTGAGYYTYEGRTATPDPAVDAIIEEQAAKLGITRRPVGQEEIIERLIYPMINEGTKILEEGIADRPGDIDAIWLHGYNWPAWKGGPMFYADLVGRERVRNRLKDFAAATGDKSLEPAAGLA
ncbi:MAG: 3-hydroxyacyl-CoA dehydrogenase NAD-binding domain-containing protein [Acetobacteraceae bacterium]|nr:3-hydroxyacyl-CoA dehydrogenase NAD-binding domain-containing protein [Acetobacteraceae bacterium]